MAANKQHAHQLLDQLAPRQLDAVVHLLEIMTDPMSAAIAGSPIDLESFAEAGRQNIVQADEWLKPGNPVPHDEVLAELGLAIEEWKTTEDWSRLAGEPPAHGSPLQDTPHCDGG